MFDIYPYDALHYSNINIFSIPPKKKYYKKAKQKRNRDDTSRMKLFVDAELKAKSVLQLNRLFELFWQLEIFGLQPDGCKGVNKEIEAF